eukprot:s3234_g18.t7
MKSTRDQRDTQHRIRGPRMEELKADLKLIDAELPKGTCEVELVDSDLFHWEVALTGPMGSPYKGGTFRFQIWFPTDYPTKPPRLKCLTPVYHCNIDAKGTVCLDLEDDLLRLKPSHETEELSISVLTLTKLSWQVAHRTEHGSRHCCHCLPHRCLKMAWSQKQANCTYAQKLFRRILRKLVVLSYEKGAGRIGTWSHDVTHMSDAVKSAASDARDIWEVVGGAVHGGIVVRRDHDFGSTSRHGLQLSSSPAILVQAWQALRSIIDQAAYSVIWKPRLDPLHRGLPDCRWISYTPPGLVFRGFQPASRCVAQHINIQIGESSLPKGSESPCSKGSFLISTVRKDFGVRGASVLPMAGGPCVAYSSLARLDAELRCNPPDAIIVMLGTNDARSAHWNAEAFQLEYCALLHRLEGLELETDAVGSRRLVLIAVPPRVTSNAWGIDVDIADNDLANAVEVVAQKMGMALVNLRDVLDPIAAFVSDGVHLTQAASALVAENAKRALLAASGAEAVLAKSHSAGYKEPMLHRNSTGD